MARSFTGASSHYISAASSVIGSNPAAFTFSCRVNAASQTGTYIFAFGASSTNFPIVALTTSGADAQFFCRNNAGTTVCAITLGAAFDSTWRPIFASYSGSGMKLGVSGAETSGGGALGATTLDRMAFGALLRATPALYFTGLIAEPAIWNIQLSDDDTDALADGYSPRKIRPQSLVFYSPLNRNIVDLKAGLALTNNGPATVVDHPAIYM